MERFVHKATVWKIIGLSITFLVVLTACSSNQFGTAEKLDNESNSSTQSPTPANGETGTDTNMGSDNDAGLGPGTGNGSSSTGGSSGNPEPDQTGSGTCVNPTKVADISRLTKIMFVVDTSGSNVSYSRGLLQCPKNDPNLGLCAPPTDPIKQFRSGVVQRFFTQYQNKINFSWGFATFADNKAVPYIYTSDAQGDKIPTFATVSSAFQSALNLFSNATDVGSTPYLKALEVMSQAMSFDEDLYANSRPQYLFVLLTDGLPTDLGASQTSSVTDQLREKIRNLVAIAPNRVSLSTIYYSTSPDPSAIALLTSMAVEGKGQFANVTNPASGGIEIEDVIKGGVVCK